MPFTTKPWDGSAGRWPDAASYCKVCLVDNNSAGSEKTKAECHFPVKEPDGTYNVNALRAVIGGRGAQAKFPGADAARVRARSLLDEYNRSQNRSESLVAERRSAELVDANVDGRTVKGYAAVYDTPWNDTLIEEMGYIEKLARGSLRKALSRSDNVPLLWQHDRRDMLASTRARTLRLKEDGRGLAFEADLPNTQLGNDVLEHIQRGDVWGMSFGMNSLPSDSSIDRRTVPPTRIIRNAQRLLDVTLTYEPAYEAATVELRSMGFVALPLQELTDGTEEQIGDAVGVLSSLEAQARIRELRIATLEKGGLIS